MKAGRKPRHNYIIEEIIVEILKNSRVKQGKKQEIVKKMNINYKTSLEYYRRMFYKKYSKE